MSSFTLASRTMFGQISGFEPARRTVKDGEDFFTWDSKQKQRASERIIGKRETCSVSPDSPLEGGRGWMRPCSYMRSSLCPGGDPLFVLWHHFTEIEKKTEGRYTDELGQTAHCTLTTAPRRSTCTTNPPSSKHRRGVRAGGRRKAEGGNGEGKITPT